MFLVPDQQLSRCDRVMQQRLAPHIHHVMATCTLRAFDNPGEPEPSSEFLAKVRDGCVEFHEFNVPGVWGTVWGTTWFEIRGVVDLAAAQGKKIELVVDLGWRENAGPGFQAEGMVYRADGSAIKSAHPRNQWIPLIDEDGTRHCDIGADGSFTLYMEAASNPFVEGPTPFSPTDRGECATGKPDDPYTLRRVDVCVFDREAHGYYEDLEVVSQLMRELPKDSPRYWQLAKALQRSLNAYDERNLSTLDEAREQLAGVLAEPAQSSVVNHVAVGHAHIDSAWLWPVRETHRKVARTVANALALMDEDPDFIYAMSSAQQYEWLEQEHPDLFRRVQQRVKEGRFIPVGGMWVESDGMLPDGESLIRQISFGQRYFKDKFGMNPRGVWLPDSFGYTGAWPQIARRAGFDWFLTQKISWNDTTKFPHHSFVWRGIDGTGILTHFPPVDSYDVPMNVHDLTYSQSNYLDKDLSRNAIILFGYGDGGGGPTREMDSRIRRMRDLDGAPKVDFGAPDELFDRVREEIVDHGDGETPSYQGELYLELHRATLTAQQEMKRGCRREENMLRVTEYMCASASVRNPDYRYPEDELNRIWKTLLLNQFHDILPGSAIAWVCRQAREEYARDIARLAEIAQEAGDAISSVRPDVAEVRNARIVSVADRPEDAWRVFRANHVPAAVEASNPVTQAQVASSAVGVQPVGASAVLLDHDGEDTVLDNGLLRVTVTPDGCVSSLYDLSADRELIPQGSAMGRYELMTDQPFQWDAWDIQRDSFLMASAIGDSQVVNSTVEPDGSVRVDVETKASGVDIRTHISLRPASRALDFDAHVDWHTKEQFLKVDLPLALTPVNAQYECQYGLIERPIRKNTQADEAKFESCTRRFVRLEDPTYAAAVVNASTYGSDIAPIDADAHESKQAGTMLRLSLLSAPLYPDPNTDQGEHSYSWSVVTQADLDTVLAQASRINAPVLPVLPDISPLAQVEAQEGRMVLDWIKMADDGSGDVILRLYEPSGGRAKGTLHLCGELEGGRIEEVGLLENAQIDDDLSRAIQPGIHDAGDMEIHLEPYQLATLRIHR